MLASATLGRQLCCSAQWRYRPEVAIGSADLGARKLTLVLSRMTRRQSFARAYVRCGGKPVFPIWWVLVDFLN
jgi:hypothetical protein